ncbi:Putrescine transport ATP-binding protein PotA [Rhodovulum sp. P5]|nr:Putrescine transport ATP-binding protein PotA [Rhodovulum sp. P5]
MTVVGPSGCGKTTLLRMIAGFEVPDSGTIRINGVAMDTVPPYRRSIGMVFQKLALFPHMTAAENVAYPLKMRRFDPAKIPGLVDDYLGLVRLGDYRDRRPHQLSGGQQQRVAIARALVFNPDLLLLDEPLSALDRKLREDMQLEFRRIQQELGVTTINVTHDQREALVMSDRIVVMDGGRVQQADTPVALYRRPGNPFVAQFIGVTSMLSGHVAGQGEGALTVRVGGGDLLANGPAMAKGTPVDCVIRAEQIAIGPVAGTPKRENAVEGQVRQRIFEGERMVYLVEVPALDGAVLSIFDHDPVSHNVFDEGQPVRLEWAARDLFAFPTGQAQPTVTHDNQQGAI